MKYLITLLLLVNLASSAQTIKFEGKSDKKFDGNQILLYNSIGLQDSATIKDGRFVFSMPFIEPEFFTLSSQLEMKAKGIYSSYGGILVTNPGTIIINADVENFASSKVTGSKENDLYNNFTEKGNAAHQEILEKLYKIYGKELVNSRSADTSDLRRKKMLQDYYKMDDASQIIQMVELEQFIKANPGAFTSIFLLNNNSSSLGSDKLESLYASLSQKYKDSKTAKMIVATIDARKKTAIGKIAPDFSQADTSGNIVKLSDFRGKYVLIDFWASWCGPCRIENPNLVKSYKKYKDKNFTVLSVSLDQPGKKQSWLDAIHNDGLTWTHVSDLKFWDNEVAKQYAIRSIPQNLLIDPSGKIIANNVMGEELNKKLAEVLK